MNLPVKWLLAPPLAAALGRRCRRYRGRGASSFTARLMTAQVLLCWLVLRLESPAWRSVRRQRKNWFPHLCAAQPRPLDGLRYLIQGLWLLTTLPSNGGGSRRWSDKAVVRWRRRYHRELQRLPRRLARAGLEAGTLRRLGRLSRGAWRLMLALLVVLTSVMALFCISQPFSLWGQFVFVLLLWCIAMAVRRIPGRLPALVLIALSMIISCRYLWWRYTATLNWDDPVSLVCGLLLLGAETYSWLVLALGYFQTLWPLHRKPVAMPDEVSSWPSVDVMIPTYNEALSVVKPTLYAAMGLDWPRDRLAVYLLDDGNRPEFRAFAAELGIHYIGTPPHKSAKAGNVNYALPRSSGEYIAIFDCDHVPTRSFLQLCMGWFLKDARLGMLQTPHHFFSPDPFERNLGRFRRAPNEGALFYGLVQDGNDLWNAAFFCGSCAVLRRTALESVGGLAVETVTEDAHTSLKMHRQGYSSAYIRIPQAAGLATESLSAHIRQRIRWARGMVQIFRLDNPLWGRGLTLGQRLCYANAMLHFLSGVPRLIFLTAPLAFLLLHAYIIYAPALAILVYVLPHMVHASMTTSRVQGKYRYSFWSEIYETVLAWHIARPAVMALINPRAGGFDVTAKGGLVEKPYIDWPVTRSYRLLMLLNLAGLAAGAWRLCTTVNFNEITTILISLLWVLYNMVILGGAIAVAFEARQLRQAHRVEMALPATLMDGAGHVFACTLHDYSDSGVGIQVSRGATFAIGDPVTLILRRGRQEYAFPCDITRIFADRLGMKLDKLTPAQHVEFIQCTFARADTWALWQNSFPEDRPIGSLREVIALGFSGYQQMAGHAPPLLRHVLMGLTALLATLASLLPQSVKSPLAAAPDNSPNPVKTSC
ncbi:UDP-forming cellulose synthase catalytic subunit [Martelella alba]|uniref:Cellulose synthase catalytic subunit [UDP-forming] n=1 Tax=Martelella alba TaxID=2590451 RepID=A0ABY2STZ7_9HYPH|nr:UDP-forming cellulose synthase catalytic subunit [Martelella alba]TKI07814.1 UDP-forming cellulose synthase catalytic subunit [Martelella alba]